MIRVDALSVSYGSVTAVRDVSFRVDPGECVLITGPSGCGKTTLARAVAGLIPHALPARIQGSVSVGGCDVAQTPLARLAQQIGFVFQNPSAQLFHQTVAEEIAFGPRNLGLSEEQVFYRVDETLRALHLEDLRQQRPSEISGGQKQRVAIAAALAMQPQALILDEPTASLDLSGTSAVIEVLQALRSQGITLIIIEHRLTEMLPLADRVIVMADGKIEADAPPAEITSRRSDFRRLGLRLPGDLEAAPWEELLIPAGQRSSELPLLKLENLSVGYRRQKPILRNLNLEIYPAEFIALVGDNGAGKSTLALAIAGFLKPTQGKISFRGGRRRLGLDVGLMFQNPADQLFAETVDEEIAFGPLNFRMFDPVYHTRLQEAADLIALRSRPPFSLSAGQQQRTALAAIAALKPSLLILDEPTLGQDWGHLERLMDFLAELNKLGVAVLLISHDYKLVHHYADRVILLQDGQIALDGLIRAKAESLVLTQIDAYTYQEVEQ